jgi:ATP-dependent protease ClpP protease subunit
LLIPDTRFRPGLSRSVSIVGTIDQQQLAQVTMDVLRLQYEGRGPITLFIVDSPGGAVRSMESLLKLLRSPTQTQTSLVTLSRL